MYLFDSLKVRKLFDILERLGRVCENRYLNWCDTNPHIAFCEREVFMKRISKKLLPSQYIKIYNTNSGVFSYVYITSIRYNLDSGCRLIVYYIDYSRFDLGIQSIVLDSGDVRYLEGEFTNGKEHKQLSKLLLLNLPEKSFKFLAYDFSKYPKKPRKGKDYKDRIKTFVEIKAKTIQEAFNKKNEIKNLMVTEEFEIL